MIPTLVDRRWTVKMPEHRAHRPGWAHWEEARLAYMHAVIRPGDVVWEIGAEQGDISVLYALWGADVVLIEPDAGFWPNIKAIFEANGVEERVTGTLHAYVDARNAGVEWVSPWPDATAGPLTGDRHPVELGDDDSVAHVTLDAMFALGFPRPQVVSVDIDGAEFQMLLGAERMLDEVRPIWFISVHPEHMRAQHGDTPDDVICHMEKHGYDGEYLGFDHEQHWLYKPRP